MQPERRGPYIDLDEEVEDTYGLNEFITLKVEPSMSDSPSFISKPVEGKVEKVTTNYYYYYFAINSQLKYFFSISFVLLSITIHIKTILFHGQDIGLAFNRGDILEVISTLNQIIKSKKG